MVLDGTNPSPNQKRVACSTQFAIGSNPSVVVIDSYELGGRTQSGNPNCSHVVGMALGATYRQALRDLPASNADPRQIELPAQPGGN
jgi:hypothetical protein